MAKTRCSQKLTHWRIYNYYYCIWLDDANICSFRIGSEYNHEILRVLHSLIHDDLYNVTHSSAWIRTRTECVYQRGVAEIIQVCYATNDGWKVKVDITVQQACQEVHTDCCSTLKLVDNQGRCCQVDCKLRDYSERKQSLVVYFADQQNAYYRVGKLRDVRQAYK